MGGDGHFDMDSRQPLVPGKGRQLDGGWDFQTQIKALSANNKEEEHAFKENSVKDISDNGRAIGAARLQEVLEHVLRIAAKQGALPIHDRQAGANISGGMVAGPLGSFEIPEAEVRQEVRVLLQKMRSLREDGSLASQAAAMLDIVRQLEHLPISVACLKSTRIAAELNQPCWRGEEASSEVRDRAASLVRRWRTMYRAEDTAAGGSSSSSSAGNGASKASVASHSRRCRNLAMDLEESAYGTSQRRHGYSMVIEGICELLRRDSQAAQGLLSGSWTCKDFVKRANEAVRRREVYMRASGASAAKVRKL